MTQDETTSISGYPPEAIVIGEVRFALDKRGAATCSLHGELGALGDLKKGRPEGHTERCRWWLYAAPGDDTLSGTTGLGSARSRASRGSGWWSARAWSNRPSFFSMSTCPVAPASIF